MAKFPLWANAFNYFARIDMQTLNTQEIDLVAGGASPVQIDLSNGPGPYNPLPETIFG